MTSSAEPNASASMSARPRPTSKWLRSGRLDPGVPPWIDGTPDNVKRAIILAEGGFNAAFDIHADYTTPTTIVEPVRMPTPTD